MRQMTIRGFDRRLERYLRELASERGISLNRAALAVLRRGAGLEPEQRRGRGVGAALDRFVGCWSSDEEREFLAAIEPLEQIDPDLWR